MKKNYLLSVFALLFALPTMAQFKYVGGTGELEYQDGQMFLFSEMSKGIVTILQPEKINEYGNYLAFQLNVVNLSDKAVNVSTENVKVHAKKMKGNSVKKEMDLLVFDPDDYIALTERRAAGNKLLTSVAAGLQQANAQLNAQDANGNTSVYSQMRADAQSEKFAKQAQESIKAEEEKKANAKKAMFRINTLQPEQEAIGRVIVDFKKMTHYDIVVELNGEKHEFHLEAK